MPPRKRAATATIDTSDTDPTPGTDTESTPDADAESNGKRNYSKRVTNEDTGLSGGFSTVSADEVRAIVRNRGRTNQFDDPLYQSWTEQFWDEMRHGKGGSWVSGRVDNLDAAEKQARNSATYLRELHNEPIGVSVRKLPDSTDEPDGAGKIYFRAQPHRPKKTDENS